MTTRRRFLGDPLAGKSKRPARREIRKLRRRLKYGCGMGSVPPLVSFLLMVMSGWVRPHQLIVIESLQAENRLLKARLGGLVPLHRRGTGPAGEQRRRLWGAQGAAQAR